MFVSNYYVAAGRAISIVMVEYGGEKHYISYLVILFHDLTQEY
jgi:hypothetical protein